MKKEGDSSPPKVPFLSDTLTRMTAGQRLLEILTQALGGIST